MPLVLSGTDGVSGVDGTASNPAIEGTDSNTGIFYPAADTVAIGTGGTERLRVDSSGNVGVGTSSPAQRLELSIVSGTYQMRLGAGTTSTAFTYDIGRSTADGYLRFYGNQTGATGYIFGGIDGTRMTIDTSGNVGIGTTSPSTKLQVEGGNLSAFFKSTAAGSSYIRVDDSTATYQSIFGSDAGAGVLAGFVGTLSNHAFTFRTNNTERARITSGGALWVGTTTDGSPAGNARIISYRNTAGNSFFAHQDVATNDTTAVIRQSVAGGNGGQNIGLLVQIEAQSNTDRIICGQYWNAGTPQDRFLAFRNGDMQISGAVATKSTGTTWANPSDIRLKDNVRDYEKGLAELMQVRVREWEYNGKGGTTEGTHGLGVVADEVMLVLPNTVDEFEAKLNENDEEKTKLKRFDATEITWLLVKSIQELKAELDATKAELNALKGAA